MYNEVQKQQFIDECIQSESSRKTVIFIFNSIERYEELIGKDFCTMSEDERQAVFNGALSIRTNSKIATISLLRSYAKWCVDHGIDQANAVSTGISVDSSDKIRSKMVQGPLQLQRYLNAVFSPEDEETIDIIYRCFLWCAFVGIDEKDTDKIRVGDVDLNHMVIHLDHMTFPLYAESLQTFRKASQLTTFSYSHRNYGTIRRERNNGDQLLRGYKGSTTTHTLRTRVSQIASAAAQNGKTTQRLSYDKVKMSGEFYRIYQRECTGLPVDFWHIAAEAVEKSTAGKEYSADYLHACRVKKKREFSRDYENWKTAFNL